MNALEINSSHTPTASPNPNQYHTNNKTLGRARDPRAIGAWLNKLTEWNMKCLS